MFWKFEKRLYRDGDFFTINVFLIFGLNQVDLFPTTNLVGFKIKGEASVCKPLTRHRLLASFSYDICYNALLTC